MEYSTQSFPEQSLLSPLQYCPPPFYASLSHCQLANQNGSHPPSLRLLQESNPQPSGWSWRFICVLPYSCMSYTLLFNKWALHLPAQTSANQRKTTCPCFLTVFVGQEPVNELYIGLPVQDLLQSCHLVSAGTTVMPRWTWTGFASTFCLRLLTECSTL